MAAWVIGAWAFFWPEPYFACVAAMAVTPFVALVIASLSDGDVDFGGEEGSFERPSVGALFFVPGLALAFRAFMDYALIDWLPAVGAALVLTLPFTFVVMRVGFRDRPNAFASLVGVAVFAYAWGVVVQINALAGAPTTQFALSEVASKRETGGRDPSHYLTLAPPLYPGVPNEVDVGSRLYRATKIGDERCVHVHRGAFAWRWYEVDFCPS